MPFHKKLKRQFDIFRQLLILFAINIKTERKQMKLNFAINTQAWFWRGMKMPPSRCLAV